MKQIFLAYLLISLIFIALLSVLSYGYGVGYVYLYWREWQIQSNIWVLFAALMLISLCFQLSWLGLKRYLTREQRKQQSVTNLKQLHPYEQLAVVWLLNAAQDQQQFIRDAFQQSNLLRAVIEARLSWMMADHSQALQQLKHANTHAFELAELQRIEVYLSEQKHEEALTHLEFLSQHELSPWLHDVRSAYEQRLTALWGVFACQFPWAYLKSTQYGHLDESIKKQWLIRLLKDFDQASSEQLELLQQRYLDLADQIEQRPYEIQVLWLKVLARLPDLAVQHEQLARLLLDQQFNQDVFYLWLQQQLLAQAPDYQQIDQHIQYWEQKYPSLPILTFAKWHVYQATGKSEAAEALLSLYPNDVLMDYLRIKSVLMQHEELLPQLNNIFESHANFVSIKI